MVKFLQSVSLNERGEDGEVGQVRCLNQCHFGDATHNTPLGSSPIGLVHVAINKLKLEPWEPITPNL